MKFFKENSYDIVRLLINQLGIVIFSFVIYTAAGSIGLEDGTILLVNVFISLFSMIFYFALLYTVAWDWGAKDKIRIDSGRLVQDNLKGAKMALIANIPNFVLSFFYALTFGIYLLGAEAINNLAAIFNMITRFWMAIYLGVIQGIFAGLSENLFLYHFWQAIGYFFIPVLAILATHIGYVFGIKEKKIFGVSKNKK